MNKKTILVIVICIVFVFAGVILVYILSQDEQKPSDDGTVETTTKNNNTIEFNEAEKNVEYRVTFEATWSEATHPNEFPPNPHFSPFVAMSHNSSIEMFYEGEQATPGIQDMAETGATSKLEDEIKNKINSGSVHQVVVAESFNSPGKVSDNIEVTQDFPIVSLVSMIAPSPDWFISGKALLFENNNWKDKIEVQVIVWDAGTDSGKKYTSPDEATSPKGVIQMFEGPPLVENGTISTMGTVVFERI